MSPQIHNTHLAAWGATPDIYLTGETLQTVETICSAAAGFRGVAPESLFAPYRGQQRIAETRQLAMAVIRACTGLSFQCIGRLFNNRDHGTVIHACSRVAGRRRTDPKINFIFLSLVSPFRL